MTPMTDAPIKAAGKAADWKKNAQHTITLPSGTAVEITVPSLPQLARAGEIPNDLLAVATAAVKEEEITAEHLGKLADFHKWLIPKMVVKPTITPEDVAELPYEDIEMLVEIAGRQRDTDAVGHQLGGLETTAEWRDFRDQLAGLAAVVGP